MTGGFWTDDYPSVRELAEDAYYDGLADAERESFDAHYAAEIEGDDELPGMWEQADFSGGDPDERSYAERLTNAPGQLRLFAR